MPRQSRQSKPSLAEGAERVRLMANRRRVARGGRAAAREAGRGGAIERLRSARR